MTADRSTTHAQYAADRRAKRARDAAFIHRVYGRDAETDAELAEDREAQRKRQQATHRFIGPHWLAIRNPATAGDPLCTMHAYRRREAAWVRWLADVRAPRPHGYELAERSMYLRARERSAALVDLPIDDGHLLVTPETAAYFNNLTRAAA